MVLCCPPWAEADSELSQERLQVYNNVLRDQEIAKNLSRDFSKIQIKFLYNFLTLNTSLRFFKQ